MIFKKFLLPLILLLPYKTTVAQNIIVPPGTYTGSVTITSAGTINLPFPFTSSVGGVFSLTTTGATTVNSTTDSNGITTVTFKYSGTNPTPIPPNPNPTPTPNPITSHLYVLAVFDKTQNQANIPPSQLAIQTSTTISPALEDLGCDFRVLDKSDEAFAGWINTATNTVGFPALVVISVNTSTNVGTLVEAIVLEDNEAGVVSEINRLRTQGKTTLKSKTYYNVPKKEVK